MTSGQKKKVKVKKEFKFPKKEKYVGTHIHSRLGDEYASNKSYEKYYKGMI